MSDLSLPLRNRFIVALFTLSLILYIAVSGSLMTVLGIPYGEPIGSPVFKIHMASYLVSLTFVLAHLFRGNPLRSMLHSFARHKPLTIYLLVTIGLLVYSVLRYGTSGAAFIIDTLIMPAVCALLFLMFDEATRKRIFLLILFIVGLNSIIAIGESITQARLIPYTIGGKPVVESEFFRSTALMGHPLKNALITGTVLLLALGLHQGKLGKPILIGLMMMALVSFGGRTGFVLTIVILCVFIARMVSTKLVRGQYTYLRIMGGIIAGLLAIAALASVIVALDLGDRLFTKIMEWDNSASVRISNWDAIGFMSASDILFGISPTQMEAIIYRLSLRYDLTTIENFWLALLMQLGAVGLIPFIAALFMSLRYLWKRTPATGRLAIVYFFLVASSNNALSTKNSALIILFIAVIGAAAYERLRDPARQLQRRPMPVSRPAYRRPVRALA